MTGSRYDMPQPYGWFFISFADEIAPGEGKAIRYFGKDMVVFRTESGEAQLVEAYCPHMGAHLGKRAILPTRQQEINSMDEGYDRDLIIAKEQVKVVEDSIECPFHAWKFNGDGVCTEVPYAKRMPPKVVDKQCLKSYHIREANRCLWMWHHPEEKAPEYDIVHMQELTEENDQWGEFQIHRWTIRAHIQEMAENGADPAHFKYVHNTHSFPEWEITMDGSSRNMVMNADMETPKGVVPGEIRAINNGPGQSWTRFRGIAETLLLGNVTPIDDEYVSVNFAFCQPKDEDGNTKTGGVEAAIIADIVKQLNEDKPIWENKVYRPLPILCDGDGPIAKFRKWYSTFYINHEPARDDDRVAGLE